MQKWLWLFISRWSHSICSQKTWGQVMYEPNKTEIYWSIPNILIPHLLFQKFRFLKWFFPGLQDLNIIVTVKEILSYKIYLNKFKIKEIIQYLVSDHKRVEIRSRKLDNPNTWGLDNTLLNNIKINEEISRKIFNILKQMKIQLKICETQSKQCLEENI